MLKEAHLPNSGRLRELLVPGATALVREVSQQGRKTPYDLWGIYTGKNWVCVDARYANDLFLKALRQGLIEKLKWYTSVDKEVNFGPRRLDFTVKKGGNRHLIEVKSVTLVREGIALFPDAPTVRGRKHLELLTKAAKRGQKGGVVFIVQRKDAHSFSPNKETDPAFATALHKAASQGIWVVACKFEIKKGWVGRGERIPVVL